MAPSSMITALCLLVVMSAIFTASSAPSLEETCKSAGEDEKFCVEVLSSSPEVEGAADTRGLARAAVLLAQKNISGTLVQLSHIYSSEEYLKNKPVQLTQCIEECKKNYDEAMVYLSNAAWKLDKGGSVDEAIVLIGGAQMDAEMCQRGCQSLGQKELAVCNHNVDRLCTVARAITQSLLPR